MSWECGCGIANSDFKTACGACGTPKGKVWTPPSETAMMESGLRVLRITYIAITGSVLICVVLVLAMVSQSIIPQDGFEGRFPNMNLWRAIVWAFAAANFVWILVIRARFLTPEKILGRGLGMGSITLQYIKMFTGVVVIATVGLVLFLVAGLLYDFLVLAGLSLGILIWFRPKEDHIRDLVRQVRQSY